VKLAVRAVIAGALLAIAAPALPQSNPDIIAARQAGVVGERYDGYLGFAGPGGERVRRQVGEVNIRRRSLYTGLATRRNATVQEVGIAAGCELLREVAPGEVYMLSDGAWRKRGAGEAAPEPSYCRR
jgi:uncharacterized protein YdbL (DUF1318 family)